MKLKSASCLLTSESVREDAAMHLFTEQVGLEILESRLEPSAWAQALYQNEGNRDEAFGCYTRIRIEALLSAYKHHEAKSQSFETRRLSMCMGNWQEREAFIHDLRSVTQSIDFPAPATQENNISSRRCFTPRTGPQLNFVKAGAPSIWLWILFIGTASALSLTGRLVAPGFIGPLAHLLTFIALLIAALAVWAALSLRQILPKEWVVMGWKPLLVFACNVVCISSVILSGHVIRNSVWDVQYVTNSIPSLQTNGGREATTQVPGKNTQLVSNRPVMPAEDY